ncbi:MAG: N-acetylmuramoyl-L-alanine amidase [Planctomycetaceae bacterium]|nr:N-acetylmuramoyl-L-alanine amidase [Planctomycetaceae bacterium]
MFSLAAVFGSLESCQRSAPVRVPPQQPRLSIPAPPPTPTIVPPNQTIPLQPSVPTPTPNPVPSTSFDNPWKPTASARDWTSIVIHHTATDRGSVESIHEAHVAREWLGIGYHFVIGNGNGMPDGAIEPTFRWREQLHGAHAGSEEYNQHGIGIALIGNFDEKPPTAAQMASIKRLVAVLKSEYEIESDRVIGHGKVKATACPGKLFPIQDVSETTTAAMSQPETRQSAWIVPPSHQSTGIHAPSVGGLREPHRTAFRAALSGSRLQ